MHLTDADRKRWLITTRGDQTVEQLQGYLTTDGHIEVCAPDQTYPGIGSFFFGCTVVGPALKKPVVILKIK